MRSAFRLVIRVARSPSLVRTVAAYALFVVTEYAMWIAMLVYAYGNGGVAAAGFVSLAQLAPAAVAAPLFATVADRRAPTVLLTAGYLVQCVATAAVAVAVFLDATPYVAYAAAVVASTAVTTTRPAQAALVPGLTRDVEELTATNVLLGWTESICVVLAGTGSGLLMAHGSVAPVAATSAALLCPAAWLVARLPATTPGDRGETNAFRDVANGISAVRKSPVTGLLVRLLGAEYVVIGALDVLFVVLAIDVLHRGQDWAGYLNSAYGAGGVLVGGFASLFIGRRLGPVLVATAALLGFALAGTALVSGDGPVLVLLAMAGASRALFDVAGRSLLQRAAAPDMVARVFGLTEGLSMAGLAVGSLLASLLVTLGGGRLALLGVAAVVPLVLVFRGWLLYRIDEQAQVPVVEISLLRSIQLFRGLPGPALEGVARALRRRDYPPGAGIIEEGDEADCYYAIADGRVEVRQGGLRVAELGRGSGMGEIALLRGGPRTAGAVARTLVTAYTLDRDAFLTAVNGHVPTQQAANAIAHELRQRDLRRSDEQHPRDGDD